MVRCGKNQSFVGGGTKSKKKRSWWLWGTISTLLLGGGILTCVRWGAWFGNRPEAVYQTSGVIDRVTITPGAHFDSERTISWRSGEVLTDAWLEYKVHDDLGDSSAWVSLPADGELIETRSGKGCFYSVRLHGLEGGKDYVYRLKTGARLSDTYTFSMPSGLDTLTRFVYMGDVQDPDGHLANQEFKILRSKQDSIGIHFIAGAGDQVESPTDEHWQSWYTSLDGWSSSMPFVLATGNHEYLKRGFSRELDPRWVAQYHYPTNGPEGYEGRTYYIDYPLMRLVVIDTNSLMMPWQLIPHRNWLAATLRSSAQPWQIVMFHHGVRSVRQGRNNPLINFFFKSTLEEYGADLVLQGHDHAYSRITTKTETRDTITPVYVISSSSPKVYRNEFSLDHDRLGSGLQLYQVISVRHHSVRYQSFEFDGSVYDDLEIKYGEAREGGNRVIDLMRDKPEKFLFNAFGTDSKGLKKEEQYKQAIKQRKDAKAEVYKK